jgi:hypothetical protein
MQCYPHVYPHLVATVAGIEPVHVLADSAAFAYAIVYAIFGRRSMQPDRWDLLFALLAGLLLLGRFVGTISTVLTLPAAITNSTSVRELSGLVVSATGTFMGTELAYLLLLLAFCAYDLHKQGGSLR